MSERKAAREERHQGDGYDIKAGTDGDKVRLTVDLPAGLFTAAGEPVLYVGLRVSPVRALEIATQLLEVAHATPSPSPSHPLGSVTT